jgi:pimeloyl-ACP methyl ester carboxylesterase
MPYAYPKGLRTYYEVEGDGDPVLLIHGAAQDTLSWRFTIPALAEAGYRVYALDLPGHGKSALAPSGPISSLESYALHTLDFMDAVGLRRAVVVGHSMSGGIILYMALHRPESVRAAVPLDGAGFTNSTYNEDFFDLVSINPTDWFEVNFRTICSPNTLRDRVEEIAFDVLRCPPAVAWNDIVAYSRLDLRDRLAEVQVPVFFVHGGDDWSITPAMGRETRSLLRGWTEFVELEGVGHFPHTERPEIFNPALLQLLRQLRAEGNA